VTAPALKLSLTLLQSPLSRKDGPTMIEKFSRPGDDTAYQDWLAAHPHGYVVNIGRSEASRHALLHLATCNTIKVLHGHGAHSLISGSSCVPHR
jgi:hypothetical protein